MLDFGFYNMDCNDAIPGFPDKYFDLAVIDPPYGINVFAHDNTSRSKLATSKSYKEFAGGDQIAPPPEYFAQLKRISKNQIIFGANHFLDNIAEGFKLAKSGISSACWIVWDKQNGQNDFADGELALTSFHTAVRIFRFTWAGMRQGNMREKEIRIHPTQKPVALYDWIFANYIQRGQKIIDTHVGSASSLIAAHKAGLRFVGFELDRKYYKDAAARYEQETAQISIFDYLEQRGEMKFNAKKFSSNADSVSRKSLPETHRQALDGKTVVDGQIEYSVDGEDYYLYPVLPEWCDN